MKKKMALATIKREAKLDLDEDFNSHYSNSELLTAIKNEPESPNDSAGGTTRGSESIDGPNSNGVAERLTPTETDAITRTTPEVENAIRALGNSEVTRVVIVNPNGTTDPPTDLHTPAHVTAARGGLFPPPHYPTQQGTGPPVAGSYDNASHLLAREDVEAFFSNMEPVMTMAGNTYPIGSGVANLTQLTNIPISATPVVPTSSYHSTGAGLVTMQPSTFTDLHSSTYLNSATMQSLPPLYLPTPRTVGMTGHYGGTGITTSSPASAALWGLATPEVLYAGATGVSSVTQKSYHPVEETLPITNSSRSDSVLTSLQNPRPLGTASFQGYMSQETSPPVWSSFNVAPPPQTVVDPGTTGEGEMTLFPYLTLC